MPERWWGLSSSGVFKFLDPVFELNPFNDFEQSMGATELPSFFLADVISLKIIEMAILLLF